MPNEPLYLPGETPTAAFKRWLTEQGVKLTNEEETLISYAWAAGVTWGLQRGIEERESSEPVQ